MFLGGRCSGCNRACAIARCSLDHGQPEYCYECTHYPCERYRHIDEFDCFITHRRQKSDLEKAKTTGIESYHLELREKMDLLNTLLSRYNDGRRKSFYCVAVNLLELADLKEALLQIEANTDLAQLPDREKSAYVVGVFQKIAKKRSLELKLRRKKRPP